MKHLFVQTAFLGDLLLSVPFLKQLRHWDPRSHISLICRKGLASFVEELKICDQVFEFDKKTKTLMDTQFLSLSFDYVFCPHQSLTSGRLVQKIKAKNKVSYYKIWNSFFFNKRVPRKLNWPEPIRQMQLLGAVSKNIKENLKDFSNQKNKNQIPPWAMMDLPHLYWRDRDYQELTKRKKLKFHLDQAYFCVAPGSLWSTKQWPWNSFLQLIHIFNKEGFKVVLIGSEVERSIGEKLQSSQCHSFIGDLSLMESVMVLSRSKALISNDSGAMHLGSLLSHPTLALFGPTVPELGFRPWNPRGFVFEIKELLCRPCGQHGSRQCPTGTHQCMTSIDPASVFNRVMEILE